MGRIALALVLILAGLSGALARDLPLFDAHIHYSHDAWDVVPTDEAVARLRRAGVSGALVSSSNDEGTQRLLAAAPDLVIPSLRPYRKRGELSSWQRDMGNVAYVEEKLKGHRYAALGEFHVSGASADLPVIRRMVDLAREHGLFLIAHSDADAVERLFRHAPKARIIWAHAGFERPERVRDLMGRHANLWADLSFRYEVASNGRVSPDWRGLLLEHSDRFMVGTDTYTPERWSEVESHAAWARVWLGDLPPQVAEAIAFRNGERLFRPGGR